MPCGCFSSPSAGSQSLLSFSLHILGQQPLLDSEKERLLRTTNWRVLSRSRAKLSVQAFDKTMKHDLKFILCAYVPLAVFATILVPAGRLGSHFNYYSVLSVIAGALMLFPQSQKTRIIGFCLLCLFIAVLVSEKKGHDRFLETTIERRLAPHGQPIEKEGMSNHLLQATP